MKNFFVQFTFVLSFALLAFVSVQAQTAPLAGFDAYVEKALRDWEIPGVAIAVVKDDRIVFAKGYGVREYSASSPAMTYKMLFDAVKNKNTEAIKQRMSKTTQEFAESMARLQKKTLQEMYKNGFLESNLADSLPPVRNQRIKGNFAEMEIYIPEAAKKSKERGGNVKESSHWHVPFVKEDGEWKLAIGELFKNTFENPCSIVVMKEGSTSIPDSSKDCQFAEVTQPTLPLVDEHTIFGVASNSKAFTAAALAMLVDEGKVNWDDKVTKYLPEYELYDSYVTREITIRDLLTHRSGLPAYGGDILWWGGDYSRDEIIRRVRFVKPKYGFRSTYAYQNIPFITAGKIVERVSGKTWEQFVKERIFTPLGMNETTTSITEIKTTDKTTPHFRDVETGKVIPIQWRNLDAGAPAAGINSNVLDMANWLRLQINDGKFDGKQLVSEKQMREMHSPQMLIPFSNPADQPKLKSNFRAYGFGWSLREYAGYKMVMHGGWTDGQLTQTAFLPEKKLGVVVLSNIHNRDANLAFINRIFDAFLGLESTDWSAYYLKQVQNEEKAKIEAIRKKDAERDKSAKPPLPLPAYAGTYKNDLYGKISFAEENGKLVVRLSHSPTFIGDLEPWESNTFRVVWRDPVAEKTFLTFVTDADGKVSSVKMAMTGFIDDGEYEYARTSITEN